MIKYFMVKQEMRQTIAAGLATAMFVVAQLGGAAPDLKSVQHPFESLKVIAKMPIKGSPDWVAVGDRVWISNAPENSVYEIDPASNSVVGLIHTGKKPCSGLGMGFGSLWIPSCGDKNVARVDPKTKTVLATIATPIADSEGGIVAAFGSVWLVVDSSSTLVRIDPASNQITTRIQLPAGSFVPVADQYSIWVTGTKTNVVTRVDPATNKVIASVPVGEQPRFVAVGLGSVWTLNQKLGDVTRIDARTNQVLAMIPVGVPGFGGDIAAGDDAVWVTAIGTPLSRIDPATNRVTEQWVGKGGDALRIGMGSIWLSNHPLHEVWRIDPKNH